MTKERLMPERRLTPEEIRQMVDRACEKKAGKYPADNKGIWFATVLVIGGTVAVCCILAWNWFRP